MSHSHHLFQALGSSHLNAESVASPELKTANDYLSRLVSYSLSSLTSEPSRIDDEANFVERELTGLCVREHRVFIDVHACSASVSNALDDFTSSLDDLFDSIPDLEDECLSFAKSTQGIQRNRERASSILDHQDRLDDLLDLPQLVDTCVRNGYYQETMELSDYIERIVQRYPELPIIRSVARAVDSVMGTQLSQLVNMLREPIKLPVMAKTIGFLRRMGRLEEEELRATFLESRVEFMRNAVDGIQGDRGDKIRYLRRYIDLFREVVYETVSQYSSIFMDARTVSLDRSESTRALDMITRYTHYNVAHLSTVINDNLAAIPDSSSLSSLLTQLGYSTVSFARLGMDFTAMLRSPFEKAVENLVTTGWQLTTEDLTTKFREATRLQQPPSSWLCGEESRQAIMSHAHSPPERPSIANKMNPPAYLSSFPPLAIYLNNGLSILNSLRLIATFKTRSVALRTLAQSLSDLILSFCQYAKILMGEPLRPMPGRPDSMRRNTSISNQGQLREQEQAKTRETRRVLVASADAIQGVLVPFLFGALNEVVYPSVVGPAVEHSFPQLQDASEKLSRWVQENKEMDVSPIEAVSEATGVTTSTAQTSSLPVVQLDPPSALLADSEHGSTEVDHKTDAMGNVDVRNADHEKEGAKSVSTQGPVSGSVDPVLLSADEKGETEEITEFNPPLSTIAIPPNFEFSQTEDAVLVTILKKKVDMQQLLVEVKQDGIQLYIGNELLIDLSPLFGSFDRNAVATTGFKKKLEVTIQKAQHGLNWPRLLQ